MWAIALTICPDEYIRHRRELRGDERKRGGGSEFHRPDRARDDGETGGGRTDSSVPRGCLQRLYADEEGRATMTRGRRLGARSVPERKRNPSASRGRKGVCVSRKGGPGGFGSCFGTRCTLLFSSRFLSFFLLGHHLTEPDTLVYYASIH